MKILIIGASGYLGNVIYKKLKADSNKRVYGTCYKSSNQELIKVNVLNKYDLNELLSLEPDIIIWSIYDVDEEMALSQVGIAEIIKSISNDVRLLYISTTIGKGQDQSEDVIPHKRMPNEYLYEYVNGKIEGENLVKKHPNHVIVRPGSIYGYDCDGRMDIRMKRLLEISKTGTKYSRTANMFASFVNVKDLAEAVVELAFSDFKGVINISGEKPISHYDFNVHLAKLMNIDSSFIIPDYKQEPIYHNLKNDKRRRILNTLIRDI